MSVVEAVHRQRHTHAQKKKKKGKVFWNGHSWHFPYIYCTAVLSVPVHYAIDCSVIGHFSVMWTMRACLGFVQPCSCCVFHCNAMKTITTKKDSEVLTETFPFFYMYKNTSYSFYLFFLTKCRPAFEKKEKKFFLFLRRDLDRSTRRMARLKSLRRSFLFSLCAFLVVLFCFCLSKYREKFPVAMMIHWIWTLFVINRIIICDRKRETLV